MPGPRGHTFRGTGEQPEGVGSMWRHGDLRDTGEGARSLKQPEGRMGAAASADPGLEGERGEGACARHLQLRLASLPHPTLKRTCTEENWGACGSHCPLFAPQGSWHPPRAGQ